MRLAEALSELGVPEPTNQMELAAFGDDLYYRVDSTDLDNEDAVAASARQSAPEFVALAEAAARADDPRSDELLRQAAEVLPELRRLVFLDTADVALNCPRLIAGNARRLASALAEQVESTRHGDGLQAYAYLEVLTRLGLTQSAARLRALDLLMSVTSQDAPDLLERLPPLVGLAFELWGEGELAGVLQKLSEYNEAKVDALFELALVRLRDALDGDSMDVVMAGLAAARDQLLTVESMAESRDDAAIYRCALDVVISFGAAASGIANDTSAHISKLSEAMSQRLSFSNRASMGTWAVPRRQAEVEWYALANILRRAAGPLGQSSWLTPIETLGHVLDAYRAARSVSVITAKGLRIVLEPTVEAAFIRREGLLAHLRDALEADKVQGVDKEAAKELLESLSSPDRSDGGGAVGKVWAAAPALAAELGSMVDQAIAAELVRAIDQAPAVIGWMNEEAKARARARARKTDPVIDQLLGAVFDGLESCADLIGTVREEFVELITEVLRFAADRADVGRGGGGPDVSYLFPPKDGKAFTEAYLQRDVNSWLKSSSLRRFTRMEEPDVAAGRADITVTQMHRFTIEVKREQRDVARSAVLAAYGGQAAAYSVVGPRLSLAMVLDLTDHTHGVQSLTESVWVDQVPVAGGLPRHVVTVVIRGNRPTPRETKSP